MSLDHDQSHATLTQLRAYLARQVLPADGRLPPERELCETLGVSRGDLRKGLAALEVEGQIWRHVGRGTFAGSRPIDEVDDAAAIAARTSPAAVMRARLLVEPQIAQEAALYASAEDLRKMRLVIAKTHVAESWRHYENLDNQLHRLIAEATQNTVLVALFDLLNTVRRTVVWGRLRAHVVRPPADHHSFAEHDAIVNAIADRDLDAAGRAMRRHLRSVERNLLEAHHHD